MIYTKLYVGQTGVRGVVDFCFKNGGGVIQAGPGFNFPATDINPNPTALDIGQFEFVEGSFSARQSVTFDIAQGPFSAYATNVRAV